MSYISQSKPISLAIRSLRIYAASQFELSSQDILGTLEEIRDNNQSKRDAVVTVTGGFQKAIWAWRPGRPPPAGPMLQRQRPSGRASPRERQRMDYLGPCQAPRRRVERAPSHHRKSEAQARGPGTEAGIKLLNSD